MNLNYLKRYIISSYILVWMLIIFVAGPVSLLFHAPPVVLWIVRNIIAWSPSYLLLIGWKYFRPDENRTVFIKRCFSAKVSLLPLLCSFFITFGISILSLFIYSLIWVVDSKFTDWRAVPYIIANIVVITSITVLMNIILEKYNNLIYSIFMHFGFNIIYVFLDAGIGFFIILILIYLLITPIAIYMRNKKIELV